MAILVTGGAGYIGSHTAVELLAAGEDIIIVDNYCNSSPRALERIKTITGRDFPAYEVDLCDKEALRKVFEKHPEIDSAIHFAGLKAVGESVQKPGLYYYNNLVSTLNLVSLLSEYDAKCIVFSSSATVYGKPETVPIREDFPLSATNPYGETKLMIEHILRDLWVSDNTWSVSILRYFNPIGAHESGLLGDDPNGIPNNLMPYIGRVAAGHLEKLNIFGGDYDTPDGTCQRDYLHVVDLAIGHLKALEYAENHNGVEAINLGTGNGVSVLELVNAFKTANDMDLPYVFGPRRDGDLPAFWAEAEKAKTLLGWEATHTVEDMCRSAWNFAKNAREQ